VAEFTVKRVAAVAGIAGALIGGAVAGGVAAASASGTHGSTSSSSGGMGSQPTAAVVRTNLATTVQVGGSIGYDGSYSVIIPSGTSAQQVAQARQQLAQAQQALANDETMNTYSATADDQAFTNAQNGVNATKSTLSADETNEAQACAGRGVSFPACRQDAQKVSQDQQEVNQASQQLASVQLNVDRDRTQAQTKVQSDNNQIQQAGANLSNLEATEAASDGTYTWLPKAGDIIKEDRPVYSVSNQPVPLLYGSTAAYRAFYLGMSDGADVGQLTHDLIALGYGGGLTQSNHYSSATAMAVARWQTALGLAATGDVLLGQVVFEPGPIRVTTVTPSVGGSAGGGGGSGGGGTVLTATSTAPIVTVDLEVTQEYLVKPGDAVSIVLPDGTTTVGGRVKTVGNVATCPGGGDNGTGNGGSAADQSPCSSSGSNNNSTPTVTVTIALTSTPPGATLDQAPVNVNITTERADNVLAAPVNALLALQGGGFGVEVVTATGSHLVSVTTGLYSNSLVQISGSGITAGTRVEVPSS
jgi:hypothetical protein